MLRRLLICIVIAFSFLSFTLGTPIDGKWEGKMTGPQGDMEMVFMFKVNGESLTGTVTTPMGDVEIINGKVNGDDFTFDVDVNGMLISHVCKKQDETISMKVPDMQGASSEIILNRVDE